MKSDEIVRVLRSCGGGPEGMKITRDAADLIETLQAELIASQRREKAAVNEIEDFTKAMMQQLTLEQALVLQPVLNRIYKIRKRGPQGAGRDANENSKDN